MSELELRGKNHRVACHKTKRLVYKLNPRRHRGVDATRRPPPQFFKNIFFALAINRCALYLNYLFAATSMIDLRRIVHCAVFVDTTEEEWYSKYNSSILFCLAVERHQFFYSLLNIFLCPP